MGCNAPERISRARKGLERVAIGTARAIVSNGDASLRSGTTLGERPRSTMAAVDVGYAKRVLHAGAPQAQGGRRGGSTDGDRTRAGCRTVAPGVAGMAAPLGGRR